MSVLRLARCSILLSLCGVPLAGGCASDRPAPPPAPVAQQISLPVITRQPQTQERQPKAGLEITVVPVSYVPKVTETSTVEPTEPPFRDQLWSSGSRGVYVRKATRSQVAVEPANLSFLVTVNNKMPRVFHGAGTVVQFNVGGRVLAVNQSGYANLMGAIVPPQQQQQFTITGPTLAELGAAQGIIGVFLYDVVTGQNAAGVVTEKQNYEWYFDYTLTPRSVELPAPRSEEMYMSQADFQQWQVQRAMQQQQRQYQLYMQQGQPAAPVQYAPPPPVQYAPPAPVQYAPPAPVQYAQPAPPAQYAAPAQPPYAAPAAPVPPQYTAPRQTAPPAPAPTPAPTPVAAPIVPASR